MSVILCTAGYDLTIRFWEALSGICSRTIQHSESQVNRLCISPDKRLLAAAGSEEVKLYDIRSTNPDPFLTFKGHHGNVTGVAFHCEGKWMVTSSEDGTVKIWDTRTATVQRNYSHGCPVNDVVIHPNQGELISCDRGGNVRIWDLGENKCTHQLIPEDDVSVSSVTVATDGTLLCAGNNNGNVYVWRMLQNHDLTSLIPVTSFQAHATYITRVLLSPDVRHLATCSADHNARIWAVTEPSQLPTEATFSSQPHPTPTANGAPTAHPSALQPVHTNPQDAHSLFRTATHQTTLAIPSTTAATTTKTKPIISTAPPPPGTPGQAAPPTPQQQGAGTAGAGTGANGANGANKPAPFPLEANLGAHQRWVWDCAFSADSAYLVTASSDHYARLWELGAQTIIRQYNGHHRGAVCVALNDYSEAR